MSARDPRLTAARPDLAAEGLRGEVEAERFVTGERHEVVTELADLKRRPRHGARLDTQLLHGETLTVFDEKDGWAWAQADRDNYVGYVPSHALAREGRPATHRVIVNRTFAYPAPDMKQPVSRAITLDGAVRVVETKGVFSKLGDHAYVFAAHLAPIDVAAPDFVSVAENLTGTPYLWGGKSPLGIDCSGLVQLACAVAGHAMPRDTDQQETIGTAIGVDDKARGDLVFWKGHVGIMLDATTLLHANAYHMLVAREPLSTACERILATSGMPISSMRRLPCVALRSNQIRNGNAKDGQNLRPSFRGALYKPCS